MTRICRTTTFITISQHHSPYQLQASIIVLTSGVQTSLIFYSDMFLCSSDRQGWMSICKPELVWSDFEKLGVARLLFLRYCFLIIYMCVLDHRYFLMHVYNGSNDNSFFLISMYFHAPWSIIYNKMHVSMILSCCF